MQMCEKNGHPSIVFDENESDNRYERTTCPLCRLIEKNESLESELETLKNIVDDQQGEIESLNAAIEEKNKLIDEQTGGMIN